MIGPPVPTPGSCAQSAAIGKFPISMGRPHI